jgi:integrase
MGWYANQKAAGVKLQLSFWRDRWRKRLGGANGTSIYFRGDDSKAGYENALRSFYTLQDQRDNGDIGWIELDKPMPKKRRDLLAVKIREFLAQVKVQVQAGERAVSTLRGLEIGTDAFLAFYGDRPISGINREAWAGYYAHLAAMKTSSTTKDNVQKVAMQFLRWLADNDDDFVLPKNFGSKMLRFTRNNDTTKLDLLYSAPEIKTMLRTLPPRYRACVLLGLNCAFTSGDIAALLKSEVDLVKGRIIYQRVKTKRRKGPVINYKLWPATIKALKQAQSDHPTLFFQTRTGRPLKTTELGTTGKPRTWDIIAVAWKRLRKNKKVPDKPLKYLRKTGATALSQNPLYAPLVLAYLADKPGGILANYVVQKGRINKFFDEAIDWLGSEFGVVSRPAKQKPKK